MNFTFIHQITFKCFRTLVSGASANATRSSIIEPTKKTISKKIFKSKSKFEAEAPVRQTTTTQRTTTTEVTTTTSTTQAPVRVRVVATTRAPPKQTQKPNRFVPTTKPKSQRQTQKPKTKIVSNNDLEVNKPDTGVADGKLLFSCDFSSNEKSCNMK